MLCVLTTRHTRNYPTSAVCTTTVYTVFTVGVYTQTTLHYEWFFSVPTKHISLYTHCTYSAFSQYECVILFIFKKTFLLSISFYLVLCSYVYISGITAEDEEKKTWNSCDSWRQRCFNSFNSFISEFIPIWKSRKAVFWKG